jgi:hypothetical protein
MNDFIALDLRSNTTMEFGTLDEANGWVDSTNRQRTDVAKIDGRWKTILGTAEPARVYTRAEYEALSLR